MADWIYRYRVERAENPRTYRVVVVPGRIDQNDLFRLYQNHPDFLNIIHLGFVAP